MFSWGVFIYVPFLYDDWRLYIRPAALKLTSAQSVHGAFNPPWTYVLLYPIAVLPERWGASALVIATFAIIVWHLREPKKIMLACSSAPFFSGAQLGQIDFLVLYGLAIPLGMGLPLLLVKPQAAFLCALNSKRRTWQAVVIIGGTLGLTLFWRGFWWQHLPFPPSKDNLSFFPYSIIIGLPLLYWGVKKNEDVVLALASLCLAPYFLFHTLLIILVLILKKFDNLWFWIPVNLILWLHYLRLI